MHIAHVSGVRPRVFGAELLNLKGESYGFVCYLLFYPVSRHFDLLLPHASISPLVHSQSAMTPTTTQAQLQALAQAHGLSIPDSLRSQSLPASLHSLPAALSVSLSGPSAPLSTGFAPTPSNLSAVVSALAALSQTPTTQTQTQTGQTQAHTLAQVPLSSASQSYSPQKTTLSAPSVPSPLFPASVSEQAHTHAPLSASVPASLAPVSVSPPSQTQTQTQPGTRSPGRVGVSVAVSPALSVSTTPPLSVSVPPSAALSPRHTQTPTQQTQTQAQPAALKSPAARALFTKSPNLGATAPAGEHTRTGHKF